MKKQVIISALLASVFTMGVNAMVKTDKESVKRPTSTTNVRTQSISSTKTPTIAPVRSATAFRAQEGGLARTTQANPPTVIPASNGTTLQTQQRVGSDKMADGYQQYKAKQNTPEGKAAMADRYQQYQNKQMLIKGKQPVTRAATANTAPVSRPAFAAQPKRSVAESFATGQDVFSKVGSMPGAALVVPAKVTSTVGQGFTSASTVQGFRSTSVPAAVQSVPANVNTPILDAQSPVIAAPTVEAAQPESAAQPVNVAPAQASSVVQTPATVQTTVALPQLQTAEVVRQGKMPSVGAVESAQRTSDWQEIDFQQKAKQDIAAHQKSSPAAHMFNRE